MAVTFLTGFEGAVGTVDGLAFGGSGAGEYVTSPVRTGDRAFHSHPGATQSNTASIPSANYVHFGFQIANFPSTGQAIFGSATGAANSVYLVLTSSGTINYNIVGGGTIGTSAAISTDTWYWIGIRQVTGTSVVLLQIDGVDAITGTATVVPATVFGIGGGYSGGALDAYFDDLIFDNAGFLAPSKVDIALPISDNTVTGVTDGNGGTSNLWQCVNNIPPAGVASANEAANPTVNIRFPASTTENYIANLETYTTVGIGQGDTILAVQSIVRHGEDIATGSKNIQNVGALTNPTVSGSSVLLDSGAHGAETGFWGTTFGTLTTSPSVTLGTSPTIRVSRVSESRVACVDFMAMYVAWTPAPSVPRFTSYPQLLAH